jgi:hypothetical protein
MDLQLLYLRHNVVGKLREPLDAVEHGFEVTVGIVVQPSRRRHDT